MSEILNINQLRELATPTIELPGFDNVGTIKVKVQKPKLMAMATQGQIPNHLLDIAHSMTFGKKKENKEPNITDVAKMIELYCMACLVEPTYEEFKDIMTDEQGDTIFQWAMGKVSALNSFRENKKDGTSNNNGKALQEKTK